MLRWLALILVPASLILVDCAKTTRPEFKRNPNLTFLTRAHDASGESGFWECSSPVWSPDANQVYYIESRGEWWEFLGHRGDIWVVDSDGQNPSRLKEGDYLYLAMSPDGEKLAATVRNYRYVAPGGTLVVIDLPTLEECMVPMPDSNAFVFGAEFTSSADKLIYYAVFGYTSSTPEGFYWFDFTDSSTTLLFEEEWKNFAGFDVHQEKIVTAGKIRGTDGSLESDLEKGGAWPEFGPNGGRLLSVSGYGAYLLGGNVMHLVHAQAGTLIAHLDVQTYELSTAAFPDWSSDGDKIVFASKPWGGDNQRGNFELWVLNQVE